jgi:hypothetical protein
MGVLMLSSFRHRTHRRMESPMPDDTLSDATSDAIDTSTADVRMDADASGNADAIDGCAADSSCSSASGPTSLWTFDEGSGTVAHDTGRRYVCDQCESQRGDMAEWRTVPLGRVSPFRW